MELTFKNFRDFNMIICKWIVINLGTKQMAWLQAL